MNAEEAKAFLKDRGIPTMNYPHGYLLVVPTDIGDIIANYM